MNVRLIYPPILFLLLIIAVYCPAQEVKVVQDLRQRSTIGVKKELNKKLDLFSEIEIGFEENISKFEKLHAELGAKYSIKKKVDLEFKYRYKYNRTNYSSNFKHSHLYAFSAEKKFKIRKLRLAYRLQYQNIDDEILGFISIPVKEQFIKNRIKLKYNIKKLNISPFASTELYLGVNLMGVNARKLKTIVGLEYKQNDKHQFKIYYRNDEELSQILPYTYHTIGVAYNFDF